MACSTHCRCAPSAASRSVENRRFAVPSAFQWVAPWMLSGLCAGLVWRRRPMDTVSQARWARQTKGYIDSMSDVTQVIEPDLADPILDDGDHERFTHIVLEGYTPNGSDELVPVGNSVVEGMINQTAVRALCGKVWVPGRDPGKYPVCATCIEVAESMGWKVPGR